MSADFPTIRQVYECGDLEQLLRWNRFLPGPRDDNEVEVIRVVVEQMSLVRANRPPEEWVAASKRIGWDR